MDKSESIMTNKSSKPQSSEGLALRTWPCVLGWKGCTVECHRFLPESTLQDSTSASDPQRSSSTSVISTTHQHNALRTRLDITFASDGMSLSMMLSHIQLPLKEN